MPFRTSSIPPLGGGGGWGVAGTPLQPQCSLVAGPAPEPVSTGPSSHWLQPRFACSRQPMRGQEGQAPHIITASTSRIPEPTPRLQLPEADSAGATDPDLALGGACSTSTDLNLQPSEKQQDGSGPRSAADQTRIWRQAVLSARPFQSPNKRLTKCKCAD